MASVIYNRLFYNLGKKLVDLSADSIKVALLADTYAPDKDHHVWADVSANEVSGPGYSAGGAALGGQSWTEDDATDAVWLKGNDVTWTTASVTARYAVLYDDTMGSKDLIFCFDFGSNKTSTGADFKIAWDVSGIMKLVQP